MKSILTASAFLALVIFLVANSSLALAYPAPQPIAGRYTNSQNCTVLSNQVLPKGLITVTENVPVHPSIGDDFAAIIFQAPTSFQSLLTLGIDRVERFQYGPIPYTLGTYSIARSLFVEGFYEPQADGKIVQTNEIELRRTLDKLTIYVNNSSVCELVAN